ncbi:hypothetical protein OROHE_016861 [Orobanche hederae]
MAELPAGFVFQGKIDHPDDERCELTEADTEDLKKYFPKTAEFLDPNALMTSDCVSQEWLVTLGRLSAELNLEVDLEELGFYYDLRSHGNKRFGFRVKTKSNSLVTDSIDRDMKWKNRFFYVRRTSLEHVEKINSFWLDEVMKLDELFPRRPDTINVVTSVVALSPRKRKFLRPATLSGDGEAEEEEVGEEEKSSNKALQITIVPSSATTSQPSMGGVSSLIARSKDEGFKPKPMLGDMVSFKKRKSELADVDAGELIKEILKEKANDVVSMLVNEVKLWKGKAESMKLDAEKKVMVHY